MRMTFTILLATLAAPFNPQTGRSPPTEIDSSDYNKMVFEPELRGKTDGFGMRFRKAE